MTADPIYLRPFQNNQEALLPDHERPDYHRIMNRLEEQNAEYVAVQRRLLEDNRREFWNNVAISILIVAIATLAITIFIVLPCYIIISFAIKIIIHSLGS